MVKMRMGRGIAARALRSRSEYASFLYILSLCCECTSPEDQEGHEDEGNEEEYEEDEDEEEEEEVCSSSS